MSRAFEKKTRLGAIDATRENAIKWILYKASAFNPNGTPRFSYQQIADNLTHSSLAYTASAGVVRQIIKKRNPSLYEKRKICNPYWRGNRDKMAPLTRARTRFYMSVDDPEGPDATKLAVTGWPKWHRTSSRKVPHDPWCPKVQHPDVECNCDRRFAEGG